MPASQPSSVSARASVFRFALIIAVLCVHIALCAWGAYVHSPTLDEPAYLASGISHWEFGRFDLCKVSPTLVRMVAAVPVIFARPNYQWDKYQIAAGQRFEHSVGEEFITANATRSFWLFTLGRWACIPFSVLGAVACYKWTNELSGQLAAYAALILWCFDPNILAHAQLLTPDIGVTSLCVATSYAFWSWAKAPSWAKTAVWGGLLGLAVLAKTNALMLYPAFIVALFIDLVANRKTAACHGIRQLMVGFVISVGIINFGYGFEGSFKQLKRYQFFSATLGGGDGDNRFRQSAIGLIPVPLPSAFVEGIDLQRRDFENNDGQRKTYFRGQWYDRGWWWYYFYVVLVKAPVGTLVLGIIAVGILKNHPQAWSLIAFCLTPGMFLFSAACSQTGFGHSLRYVLPAFPFAFCFAASAFAAPVSMIRFVLSATLVAATAFSTLRVYPHTLSYFNELAGGTRQGQFHLLDGNVDWGQDLFFITDWMAKHPHDQPIYVVYWGFLPLEKIGVHLPPCPIVADHHFPPGTYLISVNVIRGEFRKNRQDLDAFTRVEPTEIVTPAIYLFRVK